MTTAPDEAVRVELAAIAAAASAELSAAVDLTATRPIEAAVEALGLIVPAYYDAAGSLAVDWYDERRDESNPSTLYTPTIIGDPTTDWIEREATKFAERIEADFEAEFARMLDEMARLTAKEVSRGFRDTVTGNTRGDREAIGWSRIARPDGCPFCRMLADKGAYFASESSANFGAHENCNCATRAEFRNGDHGPEADVMQYVAANKRRTDAQQEALRWYLHENFDGPRPRSGKGKGPARQPSVPLGFANQSAQWVRDQIAITEALKASEWRDGQLARLRSRLAEIS